ncbi:MAG TPA: ATPase, T2SS/T4P/T4SS family [Burkholderiales bacterium]|nr:ATPase, T2SS/T4P/T4SS family [Burkholderiales bacterium]
MLTSSTESGNCEHDMAIDMHDVEINDVGRKLIFLKKLQAITQRILSASNVEEVISKISEDICDVFEAERFTIYTLAEDGSAIVSKLKTGLQGFRDIKLRKNDASIAGYAANHRKAVNVSDVYDDDELNRYEPPLTFSKSFDQRTGYHTRQVLAVPILAAEGEGDLVGVLQLINSRTGEPFCVLIEEGVVELAKTLGVALSAWHAGGLRAGAKYEHLVTENIISVGELELALRTARRKAVLIEDVLIDELQVSPAAIGEALSAFHGLPYISLSYNFVKPQLLFKNLKRDYVETNQWLPLQDGPEGRLILTPDPERIQSSRLVENIYPMVKLNYGVTTHREFFQFVELLFSNNQIAATSIGELLSGMKEEDSISLADEACAASDNEMVKLVNKVIEDAFRQGVSDIHIEPYPGRQKTRIRFRKDGTLVPYTEVPSIYRNALVARIKIMCDMDISEKRRPQDGKIQFKKFGPHDIELRVETIPSAGGVEDVVMRVLSHSEPVQINQLGLSPRNYELLQSLIVKANGLFLVCGPTGAGKTTTLHSVLGHINTPANKIWTAEDPVEITQKGLRQVQVNPKAGLTFATAMKAFLRADPDVIMVGEMRDKETASMGIEASLTGHLVFSTLHTNSAPESIVRLLEMGMDPFNFADALIGILAQRLAKRLCVKCKQPHQASKEDLELLMDEYVMELQNTIGWRDNSREARAQLHKDWIKMFGNNNGEITLYKAVGCKACDSLGYRGRIGLHELLSGTDALRKLIHERAPATQMFTAAVQDGMRTLKQDGIEKVLKGITDIGQVHAVCTR